MTPTDALHLDDSKTRCVGYLFVYVLLVGGWVRPGEGEAMFYYMAPIDALQLDEAKDGAWRD